AGGDPRYQSSHNFIFEKVQEFYNTGTFTAFGVDTGLLVAHEQGHIFGLDHQLHKDAAGKTEVVPGIMNYSARNNSRWADGINSSGKRQDDIAVIAKAANGFGFRPD